MGNTISGRIPADSLDVSLNKNPFDIFRADGTGSKFGPSVSLKWPLWDQSSALGSILSILIGTIILLVIIHFTIYPIFSFNAGDKGLIEIPTFSDMQIRYKDDPAISSTPANFDNLEPVNYTLSADINIDEKTISSLGEPMVILYRAKTENTSYPRAGIDTVDTLLSQFPDTNLIVWYKHMEQNLYVSVVGNNEASTNTAASAGKITPAIQHMRPVHIPPKAFNITLVFADKYIELYMNGELKETMTLKNTPIVPPDNSYFFPPPSKLIGIKIANLCYWRRDLSYREILKHSDKKTCDTVFK